MRYWFVVEWEPRGPKVAFYGALFDSEADAVDCAEQLSDLYSARTTVHVVDLVLP